MKKNIKSRQHFDRARWQRIEYAKITLAARGFRFSSNRCEKICDVFWVLSTQTIRNSKFTLFHITSYGCSLSDSTCCEIFRSAHLWWNASTPVHSNNSTNAINVTCTDDDDMLWWQTAGTLTFQMFSKRSLRAPEPEYGPFFGLSDRSETQALPLRVRRRAK